MKNTSHNRPTAIVGFSSNPERYSYKAFKSLLQHGHSVFLISPNLTEFESYTVYKDLKGLQGQEIDTITLYVRPELSTPLLKDILDLSPKRVIFNPGTENLELKGKLENQGILCEDACTLVLLSTNQYL